MLLLLKVIKTKEDGLIKRVIGLPEDKIKIQNGKIILNGKVCETDFTESIFKKPKHSYTKELLNLMPKI